MNLQPPVSRPKCGGTPGRDRTSLPRALEDSIRYLENGAWFPDWNGEAGFGRVTTAAILQPSPFVVPRLQPTPVALLELKVEREATPSDALRHPAKDF